MSESAAGPGVRWLLVRLGPSVAIGVVSALLLWGLEWTAEHLQHLLWTDLTAAIGVDPASPWWIITVLTLTGLTVGAVVQFMPGHAGQDSATVELVSPVQPIHALPGIAIALLLGLVGGVSLGPESPIIAINTAIVVALLARMMPSFGTPLAVLVTAAATVGAMFGTPVAAALVFTGLVAAAKEGGALWDRLFLPLAAASSAALVMQLLGGQSFALNLPQPESFSPIGVLWAIVVGVAAAAVGVLCALVFPLLHRTFRLLRRPILYTAAGGLLLGVLGAVAGPLVLFKGLSESAELIAGRESSTVLGLIALAGAKALSLLIAGASGFRGGRVFPAVFIGIALGLAGWALLPDLPVGLAVAAGVIGIVVVVTRDGWIALFLAVVIAGDVRLLPILCVVTLACWLVATRAPELIVHPAKPSTGA